MTLLDKCKERVEEQEQLTHSRKYSPKPLPRGESFPGEGGRRPEGVNSSLDEIEALDMLNRGMLKTPEQQEALENEAFDSGYSCAMTEAKQGLWQKAGILNEAQAELLLKQYQDELKAAIRQINNKVYRFPEEADEFLKELHRIAKRQS
ncbi:MAG: hypothetical protein RJQ09_21405 [Cyclobacteriaceae bacterium]